MTSLSHLSIAPQPGQATLSPAQKKFNTLIRKIEVQRKLLADWQEAIPAYQQRRAQNFEPLAGTYRALHIDLVHFLDQASDQKGLSKADRQTLGELVCELAESLMGGAEDEAMKALYNRHSADGDFDAREQEAREAIKAQVEESFGVELGDDLDLDSPDEMLRRLQEQMQARQAEAAAAQEQHRSKRKKTARQIQQEQAQQQEQQQIGQSVREVYRKLASALHPDRETDPQERERKTALMQRVNQAYASNNLLDMLQLQLEVEQIDQQHIQGLGEERLRRYNQVLAEQLSELQQEALDTERSFIYRFGLSPYDRLTPAKLPGQLRSQTLQLQRDIQQMRLQRKALEDIKGLKHWLKHQRQLAAEADAIPDDLFDLFR
ncbi:J domain-containing protein [Xylophilus sp. GW821-FHT01B05]